MSTTLTSFLAEIAAAPEGALLFRAEGKSIQPEYHVTEVKLAHIRSLDCGRGEAEWDEVLVQLLDGPRATPAGGTYMSAAKFSAIARAGLGALSGGADGELYFEYAPGNAAAQKLSVDSIEYQEDAWSVRLVPVRAVCKPALRGRANISDVVKGPGDNEARKSPQASCCKPSSEQTACCSG